jgi:hypothetical protein
MRPFAGDKLMFSEVGNARQALLHKLVETLRDTLVFSADKAILDTDRLKNQYESSASCFF